MSDVGNKDFLKSLQSDREIDVIFWKKHPELRKQLVDDTYADRAHFIFELLQNSEDAIASTVSFVVHNNDLEFIHDGKKLFTEQDITAITDFSKSAKTDTHGTIGRFGIGFKSVFKYTETPHIYSGEFALKIRDLVYPEPLPMISGIGEETRFLFPFNHPPKPAQQAVNEIEKGLKDLGDNTLLFLTHIRKIGYCLSDGTFGSLERIDHGSGHIEIRTCHPGSNESISHWMRFENDVEVTGEDGERKNCRIAIAYSIEKEDEKKKKRAGWKIIPLNRGQVSIYFPAVEEDSHLRFHIHAPFASTVARANVTKEEPANQALRDHLSELIVDSLIKTRDMGMLTMDFLAVLPNPNDSLPEFYKPIQNAIIEAFKGQELTPVKEGGHAPSAALFTGPVSISEIVKDADVSQLTGRKMPLWAAPPQSKREKAFLDSLEIEEWGWDKLSYVLAYGSDNTPEGWLQSKDDKWLQNFYLFLSEAKSRRNIYDFQMSEFRVVRTTAGELRKGRTCYFPNEEDGTTKYSFVNSVLLEHKDETTSKEIRSLLETLGVKSLGEYEEIEALLVDEYSAVTLRVNTETHLLHIKKLITYWKAHSEKFPPVFAKKKLFLDNRTITTLWEPHQLYFDKPFLDTGLGDLFNDKSLQLESKKQGLWHGYAEIRDFIPFAIALGVMDGIEIKSYSATELQPEIFNKIGNKSNTSEEPDYYINGLVWRDESSNCYLGMISLNSKNFALSKVIWKTLCRTEPEKFEAHYLPNKSKRNESKCDLEKNSSSFFIKQLKSAWWIPNRHGGFRRPDDVTKETIHPDFLYDDWDGNGALRAIGFGVKAIRRSEEYQARNQAAQNLKFKSAEEAEEAAAIVRELGIEQLRQLSANSKKPELPESAVNNPERRRKWNQDSSANAPDRESVRRECSVQPWINEHTGRAKAYLRSLYTNSYNEFVCQCCQDKMPFKIQDLHYFEAIKCIKDLKKRRIENRLALCPTCAAKYQYVRKTDDQELCSRIINLKTSETAPSVEIPINLAGLEYRLYFVGKHWFDLKMIIEADME